MKYDTDNRQFRREYIQLYYKIISHVDGPTDDNSDVNIKIKNKLQNSTEDNSDRNLKNGNTCRYRQTTIPTGIEM